MPSIPITRSLRFVYSGVKNVKHACRGKRTFEGNYMKMSFNVIRNHTLIEHSILLTYCT